MIPLPLQEKPNDESKPMTALPEKPDPTSFSATNKRITNCNIQRVYPWLLFASTAVAATFCLAYITKPVILPAPSLNTQIEAYSSNLKADLTGKTPTEENTSPSGDALFPGDNLAPAALESDFEETNIRIQHVIDAESTSGDVSRLTIDVPVLYRSRSLRWSQEEATRARNLLGRLANYQDKVRSLRNEGSQLHSEWNELIQTSIPDDALRADSPSLPTNQPDPFTPRDSNVSDTIETIKLQKPLK